MKKFLITLVFLLGIIQLVRPDKNIGRVDPSKSIETDFPMPSGVKASMEKACFDCHSNNTKYPWYAEIQPVGWYLTNHVREGKQHLNFDEFLNYDSNEMDEEERNRIKARKEEEEVRRAKIVKKMNDEMRIKQEFRDKAREYCDNWVE